jgi:exopolysaccharide production protein ExoQ
MSPSLATLAYICGIAGLFYLDRDKSVRTSKALWLPVIYLWIIGSRPVSDWLGMSPPADADVQMDGSPIDRTFFLVLLIAALCVLFHRGQRTVKVLNANWPILAFYLFCLVSVIWSDFAAVSFKRWTKAIVDVAMVVIIVTDGQPIVALRRLFARVGFLLIPLSLLYIKYYPALGRQYDPWTGSQFNTGVTLNKNMLGSITYLLSLGASWRLLALLQTDKSAPDRRRHLLAQAVLLVMGIYLLSITNSSTSSMCFGIGVTLLLFTSLGYVKRHPAAVHAFVSTLLLGFIGAIALSGSGGVAHALGRDSTFSGRTDIWADVIPLAKNPLVGAGFESFWLSPYVHQRLAILMPGLPLNEAHNGYIEIYLELGFVGLALLLVVLFDGYRRSVRAFRREPALASLFIAYIMTIMIYCLTEAGFRMVGAIWMFLLLSVLGASVIASEVSLRDTQPINVLPDGALKPRPKTPLDLAPNRTGYRWKAAR